MSTDKPVLAVGPPPAVTAPTSLAEFLLYRLYRVHVSTRSQTTRLCESLHGITRREWRVLSFLAENEGLPSSALAERAMLERASTSRALTTLADKGLIERRPKPSDRREVHVFLSERGRQVYRDIYPRLLAYNRALVADLSPQDRHTLDRLIASLQAKADQLLEDPPG